ncbi:MAG: DNA repair protein RecO [Desulfobulbaceae bacterium A2]|nr:MAG: DNA repair protein RecO [Desulfobulbaceae bacterium A2]
MHGIVIGIGDHGESDKFVTLYTLERGKIRALAKGARRSQKRFVNKLEEFSFLRLQHRPGRGHGPLLITEAELLEPHLPLRQHHARFLPGMFLCELVLRFTIDDDRDPRLFQLLRWGLEQLSVSDAPLRTATLFHLRLLDLTGYRPGLEHCGRCGVLLGNTPPGGFSPLSGTVCCPACSRQSRSGLLPLQLQTLLLLRDGLTLDLPRLPRLGFPPRALAESLGLLDGMSRQLLRDELRCLRPLTEQLNRDNESHRRIR